MRSNGSPRGRGPGYLALAVVMIATLILAACGGSDGGGATTPAPATNGTSGSGTATAGTATAATGEKPGAGKKLTIGSKMDVDGQLNAQMYALLLENQGYEVTTKLGLGQTPVLDQAIKSGAVDIYPEFTGTALSLLNLPPTQDAEEAYNQVKDAYKEQFQITWLDPAYELNDSYAICTSPEVANEHNLTTLDDLVPIADQLTLASQQDGIEAAVEPVEAAYNIKFKNVVQISEQLGFGAVQQGDADLNVCYTTDPNIIVNEFVVLEDTKNVFPIYNPAPIVRDSVLEESPDIADTLNALQPHLTTDAIVNLIKEVSVDHKSVKDVAQAFLQQEGLLPGS